MDQRFPLNSLNIINTLLNIHCHMPNHLKMHVSLTDSNQEPLCRAPCHPTNKIQHFLVEDQSSACSICLSTAVIVPKLKC